MTLPAVSTKVHYNAASGDPAQARAELAQLCDNVNALRTHLGTSSLTSGSAVLAAAMGLAVSGTDLITSFTFAAKTANYTALAADRGKVINYTTAGFTLSFTAAATLGDGWWCVIVNSATSGVVTLDPNSSELVDGAATVALQPGESCIVFCNGTLFRTVGRRLPTDYFSANKNGSDQGSIANNADTKVTFTNELADTAAAYNAVTSRFVPPSGTRWLITATASLTLSTDGMFYSLVLYKNGAAYRVGPAAIAGGTSVVGADGQWIVEGNGSDYYEIYFRLSNTTTRTVEGDAENSFFEAIRLG